MADALKAEGNKLFSAGQYAEAAEKFTQAIELDPTNHVLYSNRSGAYSSLKDFENALADAEKVVELKADWPKGWTRKGAALHGLRRLDDACQAYEEALKLDPANAQAKSGVESIRNAQRMADMDEAAEASRGLGQMFKDPQMLQKLSNHPKTKEFVKDPTFVAKIHRLQSDPSSIGSELGDPRVLTAMGVLMGVDISMGPNPSGSDSQFEASNPSGSKSPEAAKPSAPKREPTPEPEPEPEPEDEEAVAKRQAKEESLKEKELGNQLYKKRQFDEAIAHYTKAWELHQDISYLTNLAAAQLEKGDYDGCIQSCEKAIEKGREVFADFKVIARAYGRIGTAYEKKGDLANAIVNYKSSLMEQRTPDVLAKLRAAERALAKAEKEAYIDPAKAEEAREQGAAFFKDAKWAEAVQAYSEMIKRAPEDARGYSNRAACFIKLMQFPSAVEDCDIAIEKDPSFVRAYLRKAQALFGMRRYNEVLDVCDTAELQTNDPRLKADIDKQRQDALQVQFAARAGETEEQTMERIQRDPEILSIIQDPVMQAILQQAKLNPASLQEHLKNPQVRSKVQKLVAAGVIRLG